MVRTPSMAPAANLAHLLCRVNALVALRDHEVSLFFPEARHDSELPTRRIDVSQRSVANMVNELRERRPRVIVTGWGTPKIPADVTTLDGGSVDYVCHVGGTVRHVVDRELIAAGLKVSNWGTLIAPLVAEHAMLLILGCLRNLSHWPVYMSQTEPAGKESIGTRCLRGKRVGLFGFGAVARELVEQLRPFGVRISSYSAGVPASLFAASGVTQVSSLRELCAESDILVCCEALLPATLRSLDRETLSALPEGAVFVNIARGGIVDEAALIDVARERGLRLGLDVFTSEPLALDSPLFSMEGVLLSPHIAGPTQDFYAVCGDYAIANLNRYASGALPESLVSTEIYDRAT